MRLVLAMGLLSASACASFATPMDDVRAQQKEEEAARNYSPEDEKLKAWYGHNIHEAISNFGPPTSIYPNGQLREFQWQYSGDSHAVASHAQYRYVGTAGASAWTDSCREWFDVDERETIVGWHWQGC